MNEDFGSRPHVHKGPLEAYLITDPEPPSANGKLCPSFLKGNVLPPRTEDSIGLPRRGEALHGLPDRRRDVRGAGIVQRGCGWS